MDDQERIVVRQLYTLQMELFNHHGRAIKALAKVNSAIVKSHDIIGRMLKLTGDLISLAL